MTGEHAQLSLRRTGGLAGVPVQASLDTSELPEPEAQEILGSLDQVDLDNVGTAADWPPGAADTFHYELEVKRGDHTHTASFSDRQVPAELAPVVHTLMAKAKPAPRRAS
jgi:Emfourin